MRYEQADELSDMKLRILAVMAPPVILAVIANNALHWPVVAAVLLVVMGVAGTVVAIKSSKRQRTRQAARGERWHQWAESNSDYLTSSNEGPVWPSTPEAPAEVDWAPLNGTTSANNDNPSDPT